MHEASVAEEDADVCLRDAEEHEVAGLQRIGRDGLCGRELRFGRARQRQSEFREHIAHEAAAVECVRPVAAVAIGRADQAERQGRGALTRGRHRNRRHDGFAMRGRPGRAAGNQQHDESEAEPCPHDSTNCLLGRRGASRPGTCDGTARAVDSGALELQRALCETDLADRRCDGLVDTLGEHEAQRTAHALRHVLEVLAVA